MDTLDSILGPDELLPEAHRWKMDGVSGVFLCTQAPRWWPMKWRIHPDDCELTVSFEELIDSGMLHCDTDGGLIVTREALDIISATIVDDGN